MAATARCTGRHRSAVPKSLAACAAGAVLALLPAAQAETGSHDTAQTLENLAAQLDVGEHAAVATGAERLIATIEGISGRYDPALVEPLTLLGDAQMGLDDPDAALTAYDRAKHIARIDDGVQGLRQMDLLHREAVALAASGDRAAANDRHEFAYSLQARVHGEGSTELIPASYRLIDWYSHNYKFRAAQVLYEQIIDTAKAAYAPTDMRIISAIRGYANTYRQRRFGSRKLGRGGFSAWPPGHPKDPPWYSHSNFLRGRKALQEVLDLTQAAAGMSDADVATAMVEYADWNLLYSYQGIAMRHYRRAWALLESDPERRAEMFEKPNPLYLRLPNDPAKVSEPLGTPQRGVVELALNVSHRGDVIGRKTLRAEPRNIMEYRLRKAAKLARYRPAFQSGNPAPRRALKLVFEYQYYPGDVTLAR